MKGLFLNDILALRKSLTWMLLFMVVYAAIFTPIMGVEFIAGFVCVMAAMMVISAATMADIVKWESYALTMPVSRKSIVREKYLLVVLFVLGGAVFSGIFGTLGWLWKRDTDLQVIVWACGICACLGIVINAVMLPFVFRFGAEKAKFAIILCVGLPVGIAAVFFGSGIVPDLDFLKQYLEYLPYLIAAFSLIILIGSYLVSMRIYRKKDF